MYDVTTASAPAITDSSATPRRASVSPIVTTFRSGVNLRASAAQFASTLVGATMRKGFSVTSSPDSAAFMAFA